MKKLFLLLLVALIGVTGAYAQMTFIKEIKISVGGESSSQKKLTDDGYTIVKDLSGKNKDLNEGGGGDYVYLGYKTTTNPAEAITDILIVQSSSGWEMRNPYHKTVPIYLYDYVRPYYRCDSYGDELHDCDLNRGRDGSADITLYYTKYNNNSHGGTPLTEIKVADNKNATGYQYTRLEKKDGNEPYANTNLGGDSSDPPHYIIFKTHTHDFSATFNWAADGSTCTADISCSCGSSSTNVSCNITTNVTLEPTCTTDGAKECTAEVNRHGKDFSDTRNFVAGRLGHDMTHHDRVEATSIQTGNYEYWTCSHACCDGIYYKDAEGTERYSEYPVIPLLQTFTITLDKQGGIGGDDQVTFDVGAEMPTITPPTRAGFGFQGYYAGENGIGTKYYNADGSSAHLWDKTENATIYAYWKELVPYIDADGTMQYAGIDGKINSTNTITTLNTGWYIVNGEDVQTKTLVCEGAVNLILADGAKLTATGDYHDAGIRVSAEGASLTIYGQQNQTGKLIANGGAGGAGIGGGNWGTGHDITINGGMIIASGGEYGSAIGGGYGAGSSNIFVNSSLVLYADGNNPPATIIRHATDTDVSSSLLAKQYAIVRIPVKGITITFDKQDGIGGDDQTTVDEGSDMPKIKAPTRDGYSFRGYFIGQGGSGVKYYNIDGTGAMPCAFHENTTLYAYWIPNSVVTLDQQGGSGGTPQITAIYDAPMPTITVPTLDGYVFQGYYAGQNGTGTKYYNADGSSAHLWDLIENNFTLYACWKAPTAYVDADGTTKYVSLYETITNATTTLTEGWFVVSGDDVRTQTLVCEGAVNLILSDGAKLTATGNDNAGIHVSAEGASLTIYGQQNQTGQLIANGGTYSAGIGGGNWGTGHDITINGGMIIASGGEYGSAIGSGDNGGVSSNIFVNSSLVLYADNNNPPTTIIRHATSTDASGSLFGKQYAIVRKPIQGISVTLDKQGGIGGDNQITANENEEMPQINVPKRDGYAFYGYYAGKNGTGIKYYDPDGTSAHLWDITENTTLYADWKDPASLVDYIDANGAKKYTCIDGEITNTTSILTEGWYIVQGTDVQTGTLTCNGAVNIILADDAKLTATGNDNAGIHVSAEGASLTIYGQQNQSGQLIANGDDSAAGIGGGDQENGHNITINGGVITATGGAIGAGIGGGKKSNGHNITINGGVVTATGGFAGAGIGGGGDRGNGYDITINGGVVTANGIDNGAGIGGGNGGSGYNISINGGVITATSSFPIGSAIGGDLTSNIFVNAALILKVTLDEEQEPTKEIQHTSTDDLFHRLWHEPFVTLALPTVTVNHASDMAANFGTFYHAYAAYTVPNEDATIYTASVETVNNETCLVLHEIEGGVIPAATPVILRTDETTTIDLQPCADASGIQIPQNSLSGTNLPTSTPANSYILSAQVLNGVTTTGFYRYMGETIPAHKAYLVYNSQAPLRVVFAEDIDSTPGIATGLINENENVNANVSKVLRNGQLYIIKDGRTYSTQGQLLKL